MDDFDDFGEVEYESLEADAEGKFRFSKVDLSRYRTVLDDLAKQGPGKVRRIRVVTGESNGKGRGKGELGDERNFRLAASEMDSGIRISHRHETDGTTTLRLMLQEKRVFSEDTQQKRNAALEATRLKNAQTKVSRLSAQLASDKDNAEVKQQLADAQAKVKEIEARIKRNGEPPSAAPAGKK